MIALTAKAIREPNDDDDDDDDDFLMVFSTTKSMLRMDYSV